MKEGLKIGEEYSKIKKLNTMMSDCTSDMLKQQTCKVHVISDKINAIPIFELSKLYLTKSKPK